MHAGCASWKLILQHVDSSDFFNKSWSEMLAPLGNQSTNYWAGLTAMYNLTNNLTSNQQPQQPRLLHVDMQSTSEAWYWEEYSSFSVGNHNNNFTLSVGGGGGSTGVVGGSLAYHNGMQFSTLDCNNDMLPKNLWQDCAVQQGGAWWYNACAYAQFTGSPWNNFYVYGPTTFFYLNTVSMLLCMD